MTTQQNNAQQKRIAIVTGASSGMGREFARQLAQSEPLEEIWVIARRRERLEALAGELRLPLRILPMDLSERESVAQLSALLAQEAPDVRVMVNASGFGKYGTYLDQTTEEVRAMIDVNVSAPVFLTYAALPYMQKGARVLMLGSASAFQPLPGLNVYAASKAFVVHFSRALHVELKSRRITVTAVCPGYVDTEFITVAKKTKNPGTCNNFSPLYQAKDVVAKALRDSARGRDFSALGGINRLRRWGAKLLPAKLVMYVWMKIR